MSKSSPLVTNTASLSKRHPQSEPAEDSSVGQSPPARANGKTWSAQFAAAIRWLHIYVSLLGFTALTFFAITGVTLNHPTWFGIDAVRSTDHKGEINRDWLNKPLPARQASPPTLENGEVDYGRHVAKLEVVEQLRAAHHIRGTVSEFRVDDRECVIMFKGPGYAADAYIDRESGTYQMTETVMGAVAVINDLHKGRDTGPVWSLVIDISALLMVFVSITGMVLIFYLKRKRWSGIITAVAGTILFAVLYVCFVP